MTAQPKQPTNLDLAAQVWRTAKTQEDEAKAIRLSAEETLLRLVGVKAEGTTTVKTEWFTIKTVGKLTRSLDAARLPDVAQEVSAQLYHKVVLDKPTLNLRALRAVEEANPDAYHIFSRAITVKPAKPSVSVELLEAK